jgi:AraC-like DNA-binding protein
MAEHVPAVYVQAAIRFARRPRAEVRALLGELGLSETLLAREPAPGAVDAERFGRLFMGLIRLAQYDIHADNATAERVQGLSTYRLMYGWMLQAKTLGEAIERAALFFLRFNDAARSFTLTGKNPVEWRFAFEPDEGERIRLQHFGMGRLDWLPGLPGRISALYMWHRLASWMTGHFIDLEAVHIDLARRGNAARYTEPFRAPVYFLQPHCALRFAARYLELPIVRGEAELNRMLASFPAELIRADGMAASVQARVRGLLGEDFRRELPGLEEVARRLHMASATLHRRLQGEGTSFQKIKDACRRDQATALLRAGSLSGEEIAELLGFSDASTFVRAFRKWTGRTPMEFRQSGN